jgi:hypothetical protein
MPAVHHRRHRCSHSHFVDTGTVTVALPLRLLGSVLIVVLAIVDHRHRSTFNSPFSHLVVVLSAGPSVFASRHVPFNQLIVMLSAGASSSASHHASASPALVLVPPPTSASCCIPLVPWPLPLVMPLPLIMFLSFGGLSCCCPPAPQPPQIVRPSLILYFGGEFLCY